MSPPPLSGSIATFSEPSLVGPVNLADLGALVGGALLALLVVLGVRRIADLVRQRVRLRCQWCLSMELVMGTEDGDGAAAEEAASSSSSSKPSKLPAPSRVGGAGGASSSTAPLLSPRLPRSSDADPHWSLTGHVALVTGGSKGLGRAIVEELLSLGCEVLTCARDISPLAELTAREPRCVAVAADVATSEGRSALLKTLRTRFAFHLDLLVNNVGTNMRKPSTDYTDAEYESLHATNQAAAFHLSRGCFDALRHRKGCIVNVSSVSGSTVDSTGAPYHMHKAALEHMTRYLACEWGPYGIRVNAVAPWFITTPLTAPLLADTRFREAVRRATPMRRVGEPHEVACVVAFLAMPGAGYVSGQVVGIDGAMMQEGFLYGR